MQDHGFPVLFRCVQPSCRRGLRPALWLAMWFIILGCAGCTAPKNQKLLVSYIQGDVFSHAASAQVWKDGQSVECVLASRWPQFPPDKRGDVLLCGDQAQLAWSQAWLRSDTKDQVYETARRFDVTFHGTGRAVRGKGPSWSCKRLSQSIDCE